MSGIAIVECFTAVPENDVLYDRLFLSNSWASCIYLRRVSVLYSGAQGVVSNGTRLWS